MNIQKCEMNVSDLSVKTLNNLKIVQINEQNRKNEYQCYAFRKMTGASVYFTQIML